MRLRGQGPSRSLAKERIRSKEPQWSRLLTETLEARWATNKARLNGQSGDGSFVATSVQM